MHTNLYTCMYIFVYISRSTHHVKVSPLKVTVNFDI